MFVARHRRAPSRRGGWSGSPPGSRAPGRLRHGSTTEHLRLHHRLSLRDDDPIREARHLLGLPTHRRKGLIMLTPSLVLILVAAAPPPQSASKPPDPTARSLQPSPERVQALKSTIEKRRKRLAERRRIGERSRNALDLELRANTRLPATSARPTTNLLSGDGFNPKDGMFIWGTDSPPFRRGDLFPASQSPAGGPGSLKPCFT
jgi:hypothetical protein